MERRLLYIPILHIDTNLINARQKLDAVNRLEKWCEEGVVLINMSSTAYSEAKAGSDEQRIRKANQQIFTITQPGDRTDPIYRTIESALYPNGANDKNQQNDVRIVFEAAKYDAILVTGDGASKSQPGGILGNRDKLRDLLQIFSPDEAVAFVAACRTVYHLDIEGLMCVPPEGVPAGPYFARLAVLGREAGVQLLSMGMSADFEVAIEMGATHVRVGSALFGHRPPIAAAAVPR